MIYFITTYFFIRVFQQLWRLFRAISFIQHWRDEKLSFNREVTILIPVFSEENILKETLQFWKKSSFTPIFITSIRDSGESEKIIRRFSNFQIMQFPNIRGYKASQLNWAISQIHSDYIAIFDADSRPDFRGIEFVQNSGEKPIYQMYTIFHGKSMFGKASALYQSRRVLAFELSASIRKKFSYLIGHGLIVKKDILEEFPFCEKTLTEDLIFGYQTHLKGFYPTPLPYFDNSSSPDSPITYIRQGGRWFLGDFLFPQFVELSWNDFSKFFRRYLHIFDWFLGSILVLYALFFGNELQISIIIFTTLFFLYFHKIVADFIEMDWSWKLTFYLLFRMSINSLPPLYGIWRFFLKLFGIPFHFQRTEK